MPMNGTTYVAPVWEDGKAPALNAENLNDLSKTAEGAQVLLGTTPPTTTTKGKAGQFYLNVVADENGEYKLYQCVAVSGATYTWKSLGGSASATTISDMVASVLGLPSGSTVADALIAAPAPRKIASYETAGSYTWTAPNLYDGKAYKIGVMIIGAGASGCSDTTGTGSSQINYCPGGASGFSCVATRYVSPGEIIELVVGIGGTKVTGAKSGNSGGTSSFGGITALGGIGRGVDEGSADKEVYSNGACPGVCLNWGNYINGCFGMQRYYLETYKSFVGIPAQCFNPFEQKEILASGGGAYTTKTENGVAGKGGKNPLTGKGGGDGAFSITGNATATDATEPGCGGGSASAKGTPTSGAGADGAVYIYFLGVADE